MNSHPSRFEFGSNIVKGNRSYSRNVHQGQTNQGWMEPRGSNQPFWQQHPPRYPGQRPFYRAYPAERHGGQPCNYQQAPPRAYEPSFQHNLEPPHSQASLHHSPSYDPSLPQYQSNRSQSSPLSFVSCPSPANREAEDRLKETVIKFQTTIQQLEQALIQWATRRSNIQGSTTAPCGQPDEERSMKEILETPVDKTKNEFVLEQVEEAVIVQEEELVEDLGDAEPPWESRIEENSVQDTTVDAKEDTV